MTPYDALPRIVVTPATMTELPPDVPDLTVTVQEVDHRTAMAVRDAIIAVAPDAVIVVTDPNGEVY